MKLARGLRGVINECNHGRIVTTAAADGKPVNGSNASSRSTSPTQAPQRSSISLREFGR